MTSLSLALFLVLTSGVGRSRVDGQTQLCRNVFPQANRAQPPSVPCVEVAVLPGGVPNSLIIFVAFCKSVTASSVALQVVNNRGYPSGVLAQSFWNYNHVNNTPGDCNIPDKFADPFGQFLDIQPNFVNVPCYFDRNRQDRYLQPVTSTLTPSLLIVDVPPEVKTSPNKTHLRFTWSFLSLPGFTGGSPTTLNVVGEVMDSVSGDVYTIASNNYAEMAYIPQGTDVYAKCLDNLSIKLIDTPLGLNVNQDYVAACSGNFNCFYYYQSSAPATTPRPPEPPPRVVIEGGTPPTTLPPLKKQRRKLTSVYDGCQEAKKSCVVPPKGSRPRDCLKKKASNCELVIAFQRQDAEVAKEDVVVIEMYHSDPGEWFAIGLNFNVDRPHMGNTYVIECVDEGHPAGPNIYNSFNFAGKYANKRYKEDGAEGARKIIAKKESYRRNREIYCRFHIRVSFVRSDPDGGKAKRLNLNKHPVFLIAAWGEKHVAGESGNLLKHKQVHFLKTSKRTVLGARYAPSERQRGLLERHALLMTWASLFCFPLGSFAGRYLKETFPNVKLCRKMPLWLFVHAVLMTSGVALVVGGMAQEIYGHLGWVSLQKSKVHSYVGGTAGGLLLLNFFSGWFVNVTRHGHVNWGGTFHALVGHLVQLGVFAILLQIDFVTFGNAPCHIKWIVGAFVFSYFVANLVTSVHYCWVDYIVGLRSGRSYRITPIGVLTEGAVTDLVHRRRSQDEDTRQSYQLRNDDVMTAPGVRLRVGAFLILTMLAFLYSAWTTILIVTNVDGPCVPGDFIEGDAT